MKKIVATVVMVIAVSGIINAQGFHFGGKIGANLDKITGKAFKEEYNLGYHAGVFAEIDFDKKWGIQPELMWNQVNTKKASGSGAITNNWQENTKDIKLNYITIPVLLRYNVAKVLTLNLGPQFGILADKNNSLWGNSKEAFKSGDLALVAGAQINLSAIRVYGRYNVGLNNISDIEDSGKWRSQQAQIGVGLGILSYI